MDQDYNRNPNKKKTLPNMIKSLKKLSKKGKTYCNNPGCNNTTNENYNYCSDTCQLANSNIFDNNYEDEDFGLSESSWLSRKPKSGYTDLYASGSPKNNNPYMRTQASNASSTSEWRWQEESKDYPFWHNSSMDTTRKTENNNNSYSPSPPSQTSDGEISCPVCTYYIQPNRTTCEMCGTVVKKGARTPKTEYNNNNYDDDNEEEEEEEDDLYVGSPKSNSKSTKSKRWQSPTPGTQRTPKTNGTKYYNYEDEEEEDDDDDLYVGLNSNPRSSIKSKRWQSPTPGTQRTPKTNRTEYYNNNYDEDGEEEEDDLYVGPPRSNSKSTKSKRWQLPTPPHQTTDDTNQIPCPTCLYMNHPLMVNCEMCEGALNQKLDEFVDNDFLIAQLAAEQREETPIEFKIQCQECSFLNEGYASQCEACYLPIGGPFTTEGDTNMVQCSHCTLMNNSSLITCEACNKELPGAAELKKAYEEFYNNVNTRMIIMNANEPDYVKVQQRFLRGLPNARIQVIFRMEMPRRLVDAHENYKRTTGMATNEMFHGTSVACKAERYYDNTGLTFCTANCGLCGISQHGNLCSVSRHGGRMWFARNSSISLGYCGAVPIKAMFSVDVIANNNQDIIIVDKEAATLIRYLILYQN